jgi:hypothetical protein
MYDSINPKHTHILYIEMAARKEMKKGHDERMQDINDHTDRMSTIVDPLTYTNDIVVSHEESNIMKILQEGTFKRVARLEMDVEDIRYRIDEETHIYSLMRETVCNNFNEEYVAEIEYDSVFMKGSGETFNIRYIRSTMGAVRIWAESKKRLVKLQIQYKEMSEMLEIQKQEHYNTPSGLYRIIYFLKDELQDAKMELRHAKTELQNIKRHIAALI